MSGYFPSRAAAMGPVGAEVVKATFFNFDPGFVERSMDGAWDTASPAQLLTARLAAADRMIRRLAAATIADLAPAADIARAAALVACERPEGRALFAGHAQLPWPDEPHLVLWHAQTLLREFRGDGHIAALDRAGTERVRGAGHPRCFGRRLGQRPRRRRVSAPRRTGLPRMTRCEREGLARRRRSLHRSRPRTHASGSRTAPTNWRSPPTRRSVRTPAHGCARSVGRRAWRWPPPSASEITFPPTRRPTSTSSPNSAASFPSTAHGPPRLRSSFADGSGDDRNGCRNG